MTTKDGASTPDVLTRTMPALSATSDMPGEGTAVTVKNPPTSEVGGKTEPAQTPEPAKSAPSKENPEPAAVAKPGETTVDKPAVDADGKPVEKKEKPGINQRFSELTADKKAALAKAETEETARKAAEARADKLATDLETALAAINKVVPPAPEDVRPDRTKFDDPTKYDEALIAWSSRAGEKKAKAEAEAGFAQQRDKETKDAQESANKAAAEKVAKDWGDKVTKAKVEMPDFEEVITREDTQITVTMGQAILESDIGPKIAYHLGQHPEEAAKIAALPPARQLMALGVLETKLSAPPKTTETPDPITPLKGGRAEAATKDPNAESMEEYAARRNPQLRPTPAKPGART